jgi:hypothetical protein
MFLSNICNTTGGSSSISGSVMKIYKLRHFSNNGVKISTKYCFYKSPLWIHFLLATLPLPLTLHDEDL